MKRPKAKLIRVNREQGLYVLRCGGGFSCLGFDVCERRKTALATELGIALTAHRPGTRGAYTEYERLVALARDRHERTGWRSRSELVPELVGLEGWRIEVVTSWGETERFIVGKSTGYIPCHIQLKRRDSNGGCAVAGAPFRSIRRLERVR